MLTSGSGFTGAISTLRNPRVLEAGGEAPHDASDTRRWCPHRNPSGKVSAEPRAHFVRHRARIALHHLDAPWKPRDMLRPATCIFDGPVKAKSLSLD